MTIYGHINSESDVWGRPGGGGGRGGGDELSHKYMQYAAAPLKYRNGKRIHVRSRKHVLSPVCFSFSTALFSLSNSMGREDIQTCQDYNIRLFYSMWRGGGGRK